MADPNLQALINSQAAVQQALATLTTAVTALAAKSNSRTLDKASQKPAPFKGDSSADARWFLAAFKAYAMSTGPTLNNPREEGGYTRCQAPNWIGTRTCGILPLHQTSRPQLLSICLCHSKPHRLHTSFVN